MIPRMSDNDIAVMMQEICDQKWDITTQSVRAMRMQNDVIIELLLRISNGVGTKA